MVKKLFLLLILGLGLLLSGCGSNFENGIEDLVGTTLYVKNSGNDNLIITKVEIDGIDCNVSGNYSSDMNSLNISSCINNISTSTPEIVVVTDKGIYQEKVYLKDLNILNSNDLSSSSLDNLMMVDNV